ncbi:hypothetical protein TELCIR_02879 [Teladorsagia circumcincta]|uniref:Uncharacterized protein n=1 Tax=Teladorsagia circumcincta TaxID=45464 RepID=A0A2G9UXW1_TELCI|nr:hypothetical protein TELCIR_02879 [Teladorsagia circumcincta]
MERLMLENRSLTSTAEDQEPLGVDQLIKPDPRLFDAAAELKRALGKSFKMEAASSSSNRSHRKAGGGGKLVKQKNTWPPIRSIGLSMELDREDGQEKWFKFVHNSHYEQLERCFETALNYAKLILTMDPQRDPLAVLLLIDSIAIKAKQYKWLKDLYRCCKEWKNLDKLPNFCYSMALAQFLDSKSDEDFELADLMLSDALCAFPGVVAVLLDKLQIEPDPLVETHRHLGIFALNKESDGLKLVYKIYVSEVAELWKKPETLSWLEHTTRECAQNENYLKEMDEWKEKRQRLFVGIPPNIRRLAVLLGLESSSSSVTDPNPPEEHLRDVLQRLREQMQRVLFPTNTNTGQTDQPEGEPRT